MITVNYSVVLYCNNLHFREGRGQNHHPQKLTCTGHLAKYTTQMSLILQVCWGGGETGDMGQKNSKPSKPPSKYVALRAMYFWLSMGGWGSYTVFSENQVKKLKYPKTRISHNVQEQLLLVYNTNQRSNIPSHITA